MNLSKLVKRYLVILEETAYEVPISHYEYDYEDEYTDEIYGIEEPEDEDAEDFEETEEYTETAETAETKEIFREERPYGYEDTKKRTKRDEPEKTNEINEETLKSLAREVITEYSGIEREKTNELVAGVIVAQAQKTAELIINHTLESAKQEFSNVTDRGYSDGFAEGRKEALSTLEPALKKIAALTESIAKVQDLMIENFKDGIFSIISEISSKIIHREIDSNDEYLIELYRDALKTIKVEEFVTLTVSESQLDFAVRNADLFKEAVSGIKDFKIISDKDAHRGTLIVETASTIADASHYVQEEKIDEILEQIRKNLVIPQSSEELEEIEKIKTIHAENSGYQNGVNGTNGHDEILEDFGDLDDVG